MKHQTNRIRKNPTTKTAAVQPLAGHEPAKSGHAEIRKQAIAIVAEWENETIEQFHNKALDASLRASCEDLCELAAANDRPEEQKRAQEFLPRVLPLLKSLGFVDIYLTNKQIPQAQPSAPIKEEIEQFDALTLLEESMRSAQALQMLMFHSLQNKGVDVWARDNGFLADGLQTLIWDNKHELEMADDAVRTALNKAAA